MIKKEPLKNSDQVKLTFVLPSSERRARISVLGDFNNWDPAAHPLIKRNNGTMSTSVTLPAGQRVRFRYFSATGEWFNDESADAYEPGEYGAENCIVVI
jgi:1,4-alpha-glucan branching enzyme